MSLPLSIYLFSGLNKKEKMKEMTKYIQGHVRHKDCIKII